MAPTSNTHSCPMTSAYTHLPAHTCSGKHTYMSVASDLSHKQFLQLSNFQHMSKYFPVLFFFFVDCLCFQK